jgi:hypothetical protein
LAKVMAILVEIDYTTIHVNQHSDNWADHKLVISRLFSDFSVFFSGALSVKIPSPFFLIENISSVKVKAPNILLPR